MKGYTANIEELTIDNDNFRQVLYTGSNMQLVLMSLQAGEDIGAEVHDVDQFFRVEAGQGKAVIDGAEHELHDGDVVIVPAGAEHNVVNTGDEVLKLYTIYAPPNHQDGTIRATKAEAEANDEHYGGVPTESKGSAA